MRYLLLSASILTLLTAPGAASGQDDRLSGEVSQLWHQNSEGVQARSEEGDRFGDALAWGDFNGDGVPDLAVGIPGESIGGAKNAGAVNIFYGGSDLKLSSAGVQMFDQGNNAIKGRPEAGDRFGASLAAGDLNGDGIDDLAIGIPGEDVGDVEDAGAVAILFGTSTGILATDNVLLYEGLDGFAEWRPAGRGHKFGAALAVGAFFGYGNPRLAIGIPGARVDGKAEAGAVGLIVPDGSGGFALARVLNQGGGSVKGRPEPGDQFGSSFAVGDFNGDGKDDLAVGAPGESVQDAEQAGAVTVLFGSDSGILETSLNSLITQNSEGIKGSAESGDLFGWSLAAGDFNNDGLNDLAIGAPGEDVGDVDDAGAVNVLYGHRSSTKLGEVNQLWHQNVISATQPVLADKPRTKLRDRIRKRQGRLNQPDRNLPDVGNKPDVAVTAANAAEARDGFGTSIAAGDFDTDGFDDLAVGVPREDAADVNTIQGTGMSIGMVQVLYGSADGGLSSARNQIFTQGTTGMGGAPESGDRFGMVLAATDWRLAVGVPGEAIGSRRNAGAVNVIYTAALK